MKLLQRYNIMRGRKGQRLRHAWNPLRQSWNRAENIPKRRIVMAPVVVGALGYSLYILTDGAPISLRINAVFNRAVLCDFPPEYLHSNIVWDWCGGHPPMNTKQLKTIINTLPDRIVTFEIWREDEAGVFRFQSGFWRKSHDKLQDIWIEPSRDYQFTDNVGLIGSIASNSDWDYSKRLSENDTFLRASVAKEAGISHGHGMTFNVDGSRYVLAIYSAKAPIGTQLLLPLKEVLQ